MTAAPVPAQVPLRGLLLAAALVAGITYLPIYWTIPGAPWLVAWKGAGVALLAGWALLSAPGREGRWIVAILGLGALGDVLIDAAGLIPGALAFLAGHAVAVAFYWRHRRAGPVGDRLPFAAALLVLIPLIAFLLPDDRSMAPGIALYATGLAAMSASAALSRFPLQVPIGALLFAVSDLLIFARIGPLRDSMLPSLLIWPLYFAGQALIATGVVGQLRRGNIA